MLKQTLLGTGLLLSVVAFAKDKKEKEKEKVDASAISKIREEGLNHSKVMEYAFYLTDVNGPRLTASPGYMSAANWVKNELTTMGATNARLESWGQFGTGWEQTKCYLAMTKPYYAPLIGQARAWTTSTPGKGSITKKVMLLDAKDSAELYSKYAGKLKDQIVLMVMRDSLHPSFTPDGRRYEDTTLQKMADEKPIERNRPGGDTSRRNRNAPPNMTAMMQQRQLARQLTAFYKAEKPALVLAMTATGSDGTVFVSNGGSYEKDAVNFPSVGLSGDDYLRMQRLLMAGKEVEMEAEVKTKFSPVADGMNVLAEIPGSDPKLKDEVVMIGAHLDSWQAATGATDNAAGSAVMMEVMRILKATGLAPARTVRIGLWSGEEEGLFGSRNYVKNHLADPADMVQKPEYKSVVAYYNLDNGSGKVRGVYTQGNKDIMTIFYDWLKPFNDLGAKTVTISNTGGTDHLSFDAVGIPGFQFIQDPLEYNTRTHHTNMDTYDHLVPEDLKQAATVIAAFVYNTAQRPEQLPRKPMPTPQPAGQRGF